MRQDRQHYSYWSIDDVQRLVEVIVLYGYLCRHPLRILISEWLFPDLGRVGNIFTTARN